MDEKKLEVMKMIVDGEKSISWAAAKLKRSEKTIRRYRKRIRMQIFFTRTEVVRWQIRLTMN